MKILDAITLREFVPIVMLIFLLDIVGNMMSPRDSKASRWAGRIGGGTFILYAVAGLTHWPPSRAIDALAIVVRAMLAGGLLWTISRIALPAVAYLYDRTIGDMRRAMEKARLDKLAEQRWQIFDYFRRRDYEREEQEKREGQDSAKEPSPPQRSREEIAQQAKDRYELKLAIIENASMADDEREAAKLKAKQHYLQELDGAI